MINATGLYLWSLVGYGPKTETYPDISHYTEEQLKNISVDTYWKSRRVIITGRDRILATWSVYVHAEKLVEFHKELLIRSVHYIRIYPTEFLPHYYVYAPPETMRSLAKDLPYINKILLVNLF